MDQQPLRGRLLAQRMDYSPLPCILVPFLSLPGSKYQWRRH